MRYLSVCSGIEAASVAWHHLGWEPAAFSEIEPFPSAVLAQRFQNVPNLGDMTKYKEWNNVGSIDLLVGGTPCQSFSIAGLRKGLDDPRGNLMLTYGAIADHFKPTWIVWENVPGVLSSNGGRDFGTFLGMLAELGYGFAFRVLDAQHFGVAQRRRRVFVVGYLGDWRRAASVLFESESMRRDIAPRRQAREDITDTVGTLTANGGGTSRPAGNANELDFCVAAFLTRGSYQRLDAETETMIPISFHNRQDPISLEDCSLPIGAMDNGNGVSYGIRLANTSSNGWGIQEEATGTLDRASPPAIMSQSAVRRLTPKECERLQGFPDDWTAITYRGKPAADGPRYKAIGNSMAVPVMRWIGERIKKALI